MSIDILNMTQYEANSQAIEVLYNPIFFETFLAKQLIMNYTA